MSWFELWESENVWLVYWYHCLSLCLVIFRVYDTDSNGKVSFNDILEVLRDLSGSFMSDEQREVLTRIPHSPFLFLHWIVPSQIKVDDFEEEWVRNGIVTWVVNHLTKSLMQRHHDWATNDCRRGVIWTKKLVIKGRSDPVRYTSILGKYSQKRILDWGDCHMF